MMFAVETEFAFFTCMSNDINLTEHEQVLNAIRACVIWLSINTRRRRVSSQRSTYKKKRDRLFLFAFVSCSNQLLTPKVNFDFAVCLTDALWQPWYQLLLAVSVCHLPVTQNPWTSVKHNITYRNRRLLKSKSFANGVRGAPLSLRFASLFPKLFNHCSYYCLVIVEKLVQF